MAEDLLGKEFSPEMSLSDVLQGLPEFRPFAYYDKHLDAIRVQTADCSICEERLDRIMTIYYANHHPRPEGFNNVVGFAIKGVRHLMRELGVVEGAAPVKLADFLDKLVKKYPSSSTKFVIEYYLGLRLPALDEVTVTFADAA